MPKAKDKIQEPQIQKSKRRRPSVIVLSIAGLGCLLAVITALVAFERRYSGLVYPNITIAGVPFGGKTKSQIEEYWKDRSKPLANISLELRYNGHVATVSGTQLGLEYDATLSATQAYLVGRSKHFLTNFMMRHVVRTDLNPFLHWNYQTTEDALTDLASRIDLPVQDALFQFEKGKVTMFKPSRDGRKVDKDATLAVLRTEFVAASLTGTAGVTVPLTVEIIKPSIATNQVNTFGIRDLLATGYSEFHGSIPGRIHNVTLAASRLNGILIKPGEMFSFNNAIGDISAATGYQTAYIIKDGRTVLGDGGGVCQVSTTLFRAALNAGLPVTERHAHAYRVHYYEEAGFKAGLDATVFAPSVDLKIKNDTPAHILIQTKTDLNKLSLTFELYGTSDGRKTEILNHNVWGVTSPPPDLFQDDPTLPKGTVKQVDFASWGAKASFIYKVTRNGETLQDMTFYSNYRPWQAVYLKGTKE